MSDVIVKRPAMVRPIRGSGAPDFVAVARGLGCHGVHVEDADAFSAALETAFAADRPTLVHVPGA